MRKRGVIRIAHHPMSSILYEGDASVIAEIIYTLAVSGDESKCVLEDDDCSLGTDLGHEVVIIHGQIMRIYVDVYWSQTTSQYRQDDSLAGESSYGDFTSGLDGVSGEDIAQETTAREREKPAVSGELMKARDMAHDVITKLPFINFSIPCPWREEHFQCNPRIGPSLIRSKFGRDKHVGIISNIKLQMSNDIH